MAVMYATCLVNGQFSINYFINTSKVGKMLGEFIIQHYSTLLNITHHCWKLLSTTERSWTMVNIFFPKTWVCLANRTMCLSLMFAIVCPLSPHFYLFHSVLIRILTFTLPPPPSLSLLESTIRKGLIDLETVQKQSRERSGRKGPGTA